MAVMARFVEAAGQLRAAWYDAKIYFLENLHDGEEHVEQVYKLESTEELLDDAVAKAESILKILAKVAGKAPARPPPFRPRPTLAGKASPQPPQFHPSRAHNPYDDKHDEHGMRGAKEDLDCPWRTGSVASANKRKRGHESFASDRPRSKSEWAVFRTEERQAKYSANWVPGRTSARDVYENILPERLACLPRERLCDLLHGVIERWLHNRSKKVAAALGDQGDVNTAHLDSVWNSAKFKALFPLIDPPIVSLADWIAENSHDIAVGEDGNGRVVISQKRVDLDSIEYKEWYSEAMDNFLATLPKDRFTAEEVALREALLIFLQNWQKPDPPFLTDAYLTTHEDGIEVALCMWALLPRPIKLRDWIEQRMGEEIEMYETETGVVIQQIP